MKMGKVKISPRIITDALQFPADWEIESMGYKRGDNYIKAVISGSDFPETTGIEGAEIKECEIYIHKEDIHFEVKVSE
jgi:hypothetical protein